MSGRTPDAMKSASSSCPTTSMKATAGGAFDEAILAEGIWRCGGSLRVCAELILVNLSK